MGNPKFLLVKLSSLGDVLHNLPIAWDLRARFPDAQIDWVVEEGYVNLLEPLLSTPSFGGIDRIIPFGLRSWKRSLLSPKTWQAFSVFKKDLQAQTYDIVIETQGLLKSAIVCALASKSPNAIIAGLANATEFSGYEPLARMFYNQSVQVSPQCHAVDRSRWVMSSAIDIPLVSREINPQFYPQSFVEKIPNSTIFGLHRPYILCFHSTARTAKRWPEENWVALSKALAAEGYQMVFPWGNPEERSISEALAMQVSHSLVPPAFSIDEAFSLIKDATLTIGIDTGLTHLAAVLNRPTVEIYCDSPLWKTEGYWSKRIRNVGDIEAPPSVEEVLAASRDLLKS